MASNSLETPTNDPEIYMAHPWGGQNRQGLTVPNIMIPNIQRPVT